MANFDPSTARVTYIYVRRRDPNAPASNFIYDPLKYHRIRFDTDAPGEDVQYYEPDSVDSLLAFAGFAAGAGPDLVVRSPAENLEVVDTPPSSEVMRVD